MGRESSIRAGLRLRIVRKKRELFDVESKLTELLVRQEALRADIAEDENLVAGAAAPKAPRRKKADSSSKTPDLPPGDGA